MLACELGHGDVVDILLTHGADVNAKNRVRESNCSRFNHYSRYTLSNNAGAMGAYLLSLVTLNFAETCCWIDFNYSMIASRLAIVPEPDRVVMPYRQESLIPSPNNSTSE